MGRTYRKAIFNLAWVSIGFTAKRLRDLAQGFNPGFTSPVTVHPEGVRD